LAKLITTHLNIFNFTSFKSKFKYSKTYPKNLLNKSEFIGTYKFFKSIFTGEAYENRILNDNELYTFIKTKSKMSFRKYIISLLTNTYRDIISTNLSKIKSRIFIHQLLFRTFRGNYNQYKERS